MLSDDAVWLGLYVGFVWSHFLLSMGQEWVVPVDGNWQNSRLNLSPWRGWGSGAGGSLLGNLCVHSALAFLPRFSHARLHSMPVELYEHCCRVPGGPIKHSPHSCLRLQQRRGCPQQLVLGLRGGFLPISSTGLRFHLDTSFLKISAKYS